MENKVQTIDREEVYLKQGHTYSNRDLFIGKVAGNLVKFTNNKKTIQESCKIYKVNSKRALATKIFLNFIQTLLDDLTDGGVIFHFKNARTYQNAYIKPATLGERHFKILRERGYFFKDIDVTITNFTAYVLVLEYFNRNGVRRQKPVLLSDLYDMKMVKKMNEGYKYC